MNQIIQLMRSNLARKRLAIEDYSIISNNCWGAHVYQALGRQFTTPFIGLFLSPTSYLRLLANFPSQLAKKLEFKTISDEEWINRLREVHCVPWPIGTLGDGIEIHFMHYHSEFEALEKWNRRCARLTTEQDRWFFKFCDRDGCTTEQMQLFDAMSFQHKVLFTTRHDCPAHCAVRIPLHASSVPDGLELSRISPAYFDTVAWLNGETGRVNRFGRILNCI